MVLPLAVFTPLLRQQLTTFSGAAVDRIMQLHSCSAKSSLASTCDVDFLNGTDFGVRAGMGDLHGGRLIVAALR